MDMASSSLVFFLVNLVSMMCEFEAVGGKSGSKFKFGFPQLPPKFITLMYSPKLAMEYHIFIDAFCL